MVSGSSKFEAFESSLENTTKKIRGYLGSTQLASPARLETGSRPPATFFPQPGV
jgi:hypothetical protein